MIEPKQKLYQQVAADIANDIKSGRYKPGEKLPAERDLAAHYKISRPTMRETLTALEVVKLVQVRKGSGIFVTQDLPEVTPSTDLRTSAFEIIEARILFEGEAAAVAAVSITDDETGRLRGYLRDMEIEVAAGPARGPADRNFHLLIAEATRNATIQNIITELWELSRESLIYSHFQKLAQDAGFRVRVSEHEAIVDALERHDTVAARVAMREHLTRVMNNMLEATETEDLEKAKREIAEKREAARRRISV